MCLLVSMFGESRDQTRAVKETQSQCSFGAVKGDMVPVVICDAECVRVRHEDRGEPTLTRDSCDNATLVFSWLHHQRAPQTEKQLREEGKNDSAV